MIEVGHVPGHTAPRDGSVSRAREGHDDVRVRHHARVVEVDHLHERVALAVDLLDLLLGGDDLQGEDVHLLRRGVVEQRDTLVELSRVEPSRSTDGTMSQLDGDVDEAHVLGIQDSLEGHRVIFLPKISSVVTGCDEQLQTGTEVTWRATSVPV